MCNTLLSLSKDPDTASMEDDELYSVVSSTIAASSELFAKLICSSIAIELPSSHVNLNPSESPQVSLYCNSYCKKASQSFQ